MSLDLYNHVLIPFNFHWDGQCILIFRNSLGVGGLGVSIPKDLKWILQRVHFILCLCNHEDNNDDYKYIDKCKV